MLDTSRDQPLLAATSAPILNDHPSPNPYPHKATFNPQKSAQASLTVRRLKQQWARTHLRQNFRDADTWRELAREYGIRLPHWYIPASDTKPIKRVLEQLGMSTTELNEFLGVPTYQQWIDKNPDWPAWAAVGLALEFKRDGVDE